MSTAWHFVIQIKKSLTEIIVSKLNLIQQVKKLPWLCNATINCLWVVKLKFAVIVCNAVFPFCSLTLYPQLFEELDTCNTGRITEEMFKELLHRWQRTSHYTTLYILYNDMSTSMVYNMSVLSPTGLIWYF